MQASSEQPMELAQAYQHCLDIARNHYENFPTASKLLPARVRPAVAAIYAFARHADDLADEGDADADTRLKQLDAWETLLERASNGSAIDQPVFMALTDAISRFNLDPEELEKLLIAFRMDVTIHGYATPDELFFYCKHSANPIGRLMLQLHDIRSGEAIACSDAICTALQLINFWQDISVDLPRGRCYLPESWLLEASLSGEQLLAGDYSDEALQPVLGRAIAETRTLLESGLPLLQMLPLRLRLQIAATIVGGRKMLAKIEQLEAPGKVRPTLSGGQWMLLSLPILRLTLFPPKKAQS